MQTRGRNERLAESGGKLVLHGLRVAGESGRARASLGDSRVSIEFKNGNCIDIQYDQIARMQHHNTTLIPGWVGFVGLCLFYASWRVISPPNIRFAVFVLGLAMISGWVLTKRPTLTLDTRLGDCHVLHAIDSRLLKFSTMIQRMKDGLTLEEARLGVDLLNEDTEYPRQAANAAALNIPAPVQDLEPARSLTNFLGETAVEIDDFEIDEDLPRWAKDGMNRLPSPIEEIEPRQHGIIERGRANISTRRSHMGSLDAHAIPGESQMSPTRFHGDAPLPSESFQNPISSSRMIQEANSKNSDLGELEFSRLPNGFLSNFVGPEGAHIPSPSHEFISPDLPLDAELIDNEPTASLVEQGLIPHAHRSNPVNQPHPTIRRDSRGQMKRLQPRTGPKRRIASSRKDPGQQSGRFSSVINRVRETISGLTDQGIDEEIIERLTEHISEEEEEENHVPASFSALTESQEVAQAQASPHGLRRID